MDVWHGDNDAAWDHAQEELFAAGMTDGLPVTPPTRERVAAMLEHCGIYGDEVVTMLPPAFETATWRDIAINAVMAGCLPMHFPVVVAAWTAMMQEEFLLHGATASTGGCAVLLILNGPIRQEIGASSS